jgi:hypothetical protein
VVTKTSLTHTVAVIHNGYYGLGVCLDHTRDVRFRQGGQSSLRVLAHLRQVQDIPELVQNDIATRVSGYIQIAKAAKDESLLATFASAAMEEQARAIGLGAATTDPRWAAPGTRRSMVLRNTQPYQRAT